MHTFNIKNVNTFFASKIAKEKQYDQELNFMNELVGQKPLNKKVLEQQDLKRIQILMEVQKEESDIHTL